MLWWCECVCIRNARVIARFEFDMIGLKMLFFVVLVVVC